LTHYSAHPRARTNYEDPAAGAARLSEWRIAAGRSTCPLLNLFIFFLLFVFFPVSCYSPLCLQVRVPVILLFLLTFPSIRIQFPISCFFSATYVLIILQVYPYNDASITRRASVTTPTISGETLAMPSATYARLRARRRRPSRRRTPSREFVTRPASAADASSVTPQNDAADVQHIFPHAPLARDLDHLKRSILSHGSAL
jgi:hypothetical protein